jgi:orotidine-5'-phosphate decarboxylase
VQQATPPAGATGAAGVVARGFGERLSEHVARRGSQLVLGLDPDPARLWPRALELAGGPGHTPAPPAQRAALAVAIHCRLALDAAAEHCVAVKPQVACFERLGAHGWAALAEVVERAHEHGLLVIADAKRGDIDVSAKAYGQAFFGETPTPFGPAPGLGADALTVNPLLGGDSLSPLVDAARAVGGGLFVLARTSNPGAADVQGQPLAAGGSVSEQIARLIESLAPAGCGLSDVGAVVGATAPEWLERLRATMPRTPFLLPGIGAQGGRVEDLAPVFAPGRAGGLISASRGIVNAYERDGSEPALAAGREAARLRELAWSLSG